MSRNIETELRAFDVDPDSIRESLVKLGAVALSDGPLLQRRAVMDTVPPHPDRWIRVRTNGEKTTLAVKDRRSGAEDGETEVEVDDFDATLLALRLAGIPKPRSVQENYREAYELDGNEVTIDVWPHLNPLVEIEAPTEAEIRALGARIGLEDGSLTDRPIEVVYREKKGIEPLTTDILFDDLESYAS